MELSTKIENEEVAVSKVYIQLAIAKFAAVHSSSPLQQIAALTRPTKGDGTMRKKNRDEGRHRNTPQIC